MYTHTQRGDVIILSAVLGGAVTFLSTLFLGPVTALLSTALLVGILALFGSLTVTVDGDLIEARFGPGVIRFSWKQSEVVSAQPMTTPWYCGWGIRYTGSGWLFNVSGTESVELTLKGGEKVRIGTDDVEGLLAAIRAN